MSDRDTRIAAFLAKQGWDAADRRTLADDASFRRYDRLTGQGRSAVLMDAPPAKEDVRPFVSIAEILRSLDLSAPEILAQSPEDGLLLLEDFGDDTYTRVLAADPDCETELYMLAVDLLIELHRRFTVAADIPKYDDALLLTEANLLIDWYLPAITGNTVTDSLRQDYAKLWQALFVQTRDTRETLVLRDYHVDNLIWLPRRAGIRACGLLDFQDAVIGPAAYDLVSLLEDARRDVPSDLAQRAMDRYLAAFPDIDPDAFRLSYAILGAQRSTKILGIFTRLDRRDGKPDYLCHLPRVWRWLEADLNHPALAALRDWFNRVLPPETRTIKT
ncbi:MAG: phosphotransferase [Alphaproteobacteria bacterium]|nr:phosphotransferase [Alphaproteobacteria bacterium]